jgi:hypothetical protein
MLSSLNLSTVVPQDLIAENDHENLLNCVSFHSIEEAGIVFFGTKLQTPLMRTTQWERGPRGSLV